MKWSLLPLLAALAITSSAPAAETPAIPETPGRFQIVTTHLGPGKEAAPIVLKIDTATGRVWRLVLGERSIFFAEIDSLPLDDLIKEDLAQRDREAQLEQAKTMELWCLRFPNGGVLEINGEKTTVTKAQRDQKLKEAREEIARLSKPER